ncbi:MAG: CCA tRNA nucleotidyltransferase [Bacillota bacterium]
MNEDVHIPIPEQLTRLARLFSQAGARLYGVGGMVRNPLLGVPASDIDICSRLRPDEARALCEGDGLRVIPTGEKFGTVSILFPDGFLTEHTTFRSDVYGEGGAHRPTSVEFGESVETDAFRRDFSCNALYVDLESGEILDPTGGMEDIRRKVLRTTTKDPELILRDDALRILRMARFAARLGFSVDPDTEAAAHRLVKGLDDIARERVRAELEKTLLADGERVLEALRLLERTGALERILPELIKGRGVEQPGPYHAYTVIEHVFHVCAVMPKVLHLRLAGLLHDVGKPYAIEKNRIDPVRPGRSPMIGHDALGVEISREILERLRFPNAVRDRVLPLVERHMYDLDGRAKESTLRARFADWGDAFVEDLILMREADVVGSGMETGPVATAERWRDLLQRMRREGAPFSEAQLACTGEELMQWLEIAPGPEIGRIKHQLLLHCARHPSDNTPTRLRHIARNFK